MGILQLAGRPRVRARSSHGRRSMMKAATGLPSGVLLPAVAFPLPGRCRPGSGRSGLERGFPAQPTPVWCSCGGRDAPARRTPGGNRGRPHLSVSRAWDYLRIVLKRKIELPPVHLYPGGTNGASSRRGTQMSLSGSVGARDFDGRLSFAPRLPHAWNELAFSLRFGGRQIRVRLTHDEECHLVDNGAPLKCSSGGSPTCSARDRGRDQAPATMTGTLRSHRSPAPVPQLRPGARFAPEIAWS